MRSLLSMAVKTRTLGVFVILSGLMLCLTRPADGQTTKLTVKSYDIDAVILTGGKTVRVEADLTVIKSDTSDRAQILLGSGANVFAIRCRKDSAWVEMPFRFAGKDTLLFDFPTEVNRVGGIEIRFSYDFPIDSLGDSLLLLDRGSRWYPLIPDQVASFRMSCEVPPGYTVLSAGNLVEREASEDGSRFVWGSSIPIFKLVLVVFRSDSYRRDSVRVFSKSIVLYSSAGSAAADSLSAEAEKAFTYFSGLVGGYPYNSLTFVEVPYFDGVDISSGLVMAGSPVIKGAGMGYYEPLDLAVAEQWFGAGVFAEFLRPGFWFMTVSLPHYLRLMYVRHSMGDSAYAAAIREPMNGYEKFAGNENDVSILDVDYPNTREKGLILYGKGPYALGKIEAELGGERWQSLLRELYDKFRGKVLTYGEFRDRVAAYGRSPHTLELFDSLMTEKGMPAR